MIEFACHCGFAFSVQPDMAGAMVQCPKCRRLNDVPLLSDLEHIEDGGIYKLEEPVVPPKNSLLEMHRVFTRDHVDPDGVEIDLRPTVENFERAGGEEVPHELHDQLRPGAPKYDPFTGELIEPLDIKEEKDRIDPKLVRSLPVAAIAPQPRDDGTLGPLEVVAIPARLFRPINLVVMGFILLGHLLAFVTAVISGFGFFFIAPILPILHMAFLAHYANVIDEIGPAERSELPTPLRGVNWHEDTWGPFWQWTVAFFASYGLAMLALMQRESLPAPIPLMLAGALAAIGTLAFPAVVLTTVTSGSVLNLRPDRIAGVIRVCGAEYVLSALLWLVGGFTYLWGTVGVVWMGLIAINPNFYNAMPRGFLSIARFLDIYFTLPALVVGLYLMHFMCWHLGTLYRRFHEDFPWVLQRFQSNRPKGFAVAAPRRASRKPAPPAPSRPVKASR